MITDFFLKLSLLLSEGLIFAVLALGIYVLFRWARFPDLTPDGSFALGAAVYVKLALLEFPPLIAVIAAMLFGAIAGIITASVHHLGKIPTVVSGLLVSSSLYSFVWLFLGKPNQFINRKQTFVSSLSGIKSSLLLNSILISITFFCCIILFFFSKSIWGLRLRAIGENPHLAYDLKTSNFLNTGLGLAIGNSLVGLSGALFVQRSFSANLNMGIGMTINGLAGMIIGLLLIKTQKTKFFTLFSIVLGSILFKSILFIALEIGLPAEFFKIVSSFILIFALAVFKSSDSMLKGLKWT